MKKYLLLIYLSMISITVLAQTSPGMIASNGAYFNVLKINALESAPAYFYMDTNIPANDAPGPQISISGYMYYGDNTAMKVTLGWYYYQGSFYWSQYQSELGYNKPSRIRLGKYAKNGSEYIRIEISNNSTYWANYSVSATDRLDFASFYTGWTYTVGEMPASTTTQIVTVNQQADVVIDGKLGIGTSTPAEKLSVNGKIRAREVKVETDNWPDYVFEDSYRMDSLSEIAKYIRINKHLPEMPSADKVNKDGIELGEMNTLLLKKVEELTLHLIQQNEHLNKQEKITIAQQKRIFELSREVESHRK